jgi:putative spermidine/putrescine transport system permease protein
VSTDAARVRGGSRRGGVLRSLSRLSWRRPGLKTFGQISAPVAAFLFVYVAALLALLIQGFWTTDSFTGKVVHSWNLDNFREIANAPYPTIILRTLGIASAVTVTCMLLAFPYAYFLVRIASRRLRIALLVATVLPLWVSYLVRVYSWRLILNPDGALNYFLNRLGLPDQNIAYTNWAMWLVFTYIWFPFMVLPVYAALERVPNSFLEASADLGASGFTTLRRVILPLAVPGLAAGSIFTFSLTLGDYIAPSLVGGPGSSLIGTVVYDNLGLANNAPFAAAFAMVPLGIMAVYLVIMKRLGAFESL